MEACIFQWKVSLSNKHLSDLGIRTAPVTPIDKDRTMTTVYEADESEDFPAPTPLKAPNHSRPPLSKASSTFD